MCGSRVISCDFRMGLNVGRWRIREETWTRWRGSVGSDANIPIIDRKLCVCVFVCVRAWACGKRKPCVVEPLKQLFVPTTASTIFIFFPKVNVYEFTLVFLFVFFYTYSALVNVFFQIITFSLLRSSLTQTPFRAFGVQLKLVVSVDGFGAAPEYL